MVSGSDLSRVRWPLATCAESWSTEKDISGEKKKKKYNDYLGRVALETVERVDGSRKVPHRRRRCCCHSTPQHAHPHAAAACCQTQRHRISFRRTRKEEEEKKKKKKKKKEKERVKGKEGTQLFVCFLPPLTLSLPLES